MDNIDNNIMDSIGNDIVTSQEDELLVSSFFEENKAEIADNGFSERVMRRLPSPALRLNRIWTAVCAVLGIALVINELVDIKLADIKISIPNLLTDFSEAVMRHISQFDYSLHNMMTLATGTITLTVILLYNVWEEQKTHY